MVSKGVSAAAPAVIFAGVPHLLNIIHGFYRSPGESALPARKSFLLASKDFRPCVDGDQQGTEVLYPHDPDGLRRPAPARAAAFTSSTSCAARDGAAARKDGVDGLVFRQAPAVLRPMPPLPTMSLTPVFCEKFLFVFFHPHAVVGADGDHVVFSAAVGPLPHDGTRMKDRFSGKVHRSVRRA